MNVFKLWGRRILIVGGLAILILLVTDFNSRMAELTRLRSQSEDETAKLNELTATRDALQTQIAYSSSDAAVEAWAREQGRMSKPGDYPIIPLADPDYSPPPEKTTNVETQDPSNWQAWMEWLFGTAP